MARNKKGTLASMIKDLFYEHFTYMRQYKSFYLSTNTEMTEKQIWKEDVALLPRMRSSVRDPAPKNYGYFNIQACVPEDFKRHRIVSVSQTVSFPQFRTPPHPSP